MSEYSKTAIYAITHICVAVITNICSNTTPLKNVALSIIASLYVRPSICVTRASNSRIESGTKSSATAEIAGDADETAIQGHSRSSVVVPIDATYMASY